MHNLVFIGDVSGNKASITTSGQLKVDATVNATANISGQPVQISGQTVVANVVTNISGQTVAVSNVGSITALPTISISGNMVSISGQPVVASVTTNISGQVVYHVSGQNTAQISGQTVLTSVSGNMVSISGQPVTGSFTASISGQPVLISGQTVVANVQSTTNISGQVVYLINDGINNVVKVSGQTLVIPFTSISGNMVSISGQPVTATVQAGPTNISGQVVYLVSGQNDVQISGQRVLTSVSGNVVKISGEAVLISGQIIRILDDGLANNVYVRDTNGRILNLLAQTTSDNESTGLDPLVTVGFSYGFDANAGGWARLKTTTSGDGHRLIVSVSGQPVTGSFTASVSGQPVLISGQTVIANIQSTTNISGQVVYLVNDGVNNVVQISGQTLVIPFTSVSGNVVRISGSMVSISGQPVSISGNVVVASVTTNISGQTVYLTNDGTNNLVGIIDTNGNSIEVASHLSGDTYFDGSTGSFKGLITAAIGYGYDTVTEGFKRLRVTSSGDGFKLIVSISGQPVTASVQAGPTNISGQVVYLVNDGLNNAVQVSGQTLVIPFTSISGNAVRISGSMVSTSGQPSNVSGSTVSVSGSIAVNNFPTFTLVSGQTVYTINDGLNNVVKVSGETLVIPFTSVSGNAVRISGSMVSVSGQAISVSGNIIAISGLVRLDPGFVHISGEVVRVSGSMVSVSGQAVSVSGNMVSVSGQPANVSGSTVSVSGIVGVNSLPVISVSGNAISVSGNMVNVSGQAARISGETVSVSGIVQQRIPTAMRTRALLQCTSLSGGTQLLSGDVKIATLINAGTSGTVMYIGSTTDPPFSGKGIILAAGNGYTLEIDNFNRLWSFAATSGQFLSYGGVAY
jgi:hypothetical protein